MLDIVCLTDNEIMSPEFEDAYLRYVAIAFDKQLNLGDLIGNRNWGFDMDSGLLTFASQGIGDQPIVFDVQILGTASEQSSSWLWPWANKSIEENLATDSLFVSEQAGISEFPHSQFAIDFGQSDEHRITMVSVGILSQLARCDAYYRGPYEGGAAFFLLKDSRLQLAPPSATHIATFFPQLISSLPLSNHRAAFFGYLEQLQVEGQSDGQNITARIGSSDLTAQFDNLNRLSNLHVVARPT